MNLISISCVGCFESQPMFSVLCPTIQQRLPSFPKPFLLFASVSIKWTKSSSWKNSEQKTGRLVCSHQKKTAFTFPPSEPKRGKKSSKLALMPYQKMQGIGKVCSIQRTGWEKASVLLFLSPKWHGTHALQQFDRGDKEYVSGVRRCGAGNRWSFGNRGILSVVLSKSFYETYLVFCECFV